MKPRVAMLLLACASLGWMALAPDAARPLPAPIEPAAAAVPSTRVAAPPAPATGPWTEQVDRPLFAQGRRPPAAPVQPADIPVVAPEPPSPVAAAGVVLRPSGAVALLRLADARIVRVAEGEEVDGWQVHRIHVDGVEVTRGGTTVTLPARAPSAPGLEPAE